MVLCSSIGLSKFMIGWISSGATPASSGCYLYFGLGCCMLSFGVAYLRGRMAFLPDQLIDEMRDEERYECAPCTEERLREACEMTKPYYGHEYVEPDVAVQWRSRNPTGFVQIVNSSGELCACFGVLGLSQSFMDQYIKGNVDDTQLRGDDVLSLPASKRATSLYISGVVVRNPESHKGRKRANVMIWAMMTYVRQIYGLRKKRELYAVAVTRESERLMQNLGFTVASRANGRRDKCNLYCSELTPEFWKQLMCKVGDWSALCTCRFSPAQQK